MKKNFYILIPFVLFGLFACKRDQVCECLDDNLSEIKNFREKNYVGKLNTSIPSCTQFKIDTQEFEKLSKHCPNAKEMQDEQVLMIQHQIDVMKQKNQEMQKFIQDEMKSLDELKKDLNMK